MTQPARHPARRDFLKASAALAAAGLLPGAALPPAWLLLVNPGVALATAEVFAARTGNFSAPAPWTDMP